MGLRLATALEHRRRIRRSVGWLQEQLQARPDAWPTLQELSGAAALSPFHFLRLYQRATGETPGATALRLKLQSARELLQAQPGRKVLDVALEHGYDSAQAFSRAYRRQFGIAPSDRPLADHELAAAAWVVALPDLRLRSLAVGAAQDVGGAFDELMGQLDVAEVPRHCQDMFSVISPDLRFTQACALENEPVRRSLRLPILHVEGGPHVCLGGPRNAVWRRWRDPAIAAARDPGRPLLLRYLNDPAYRARQDQRIELYMPLRPGGGAVALHG